MSEFLSEFLSRLLSKCLSLLLRVFLFKVSVMVSVKRAIKCRNWSNSLEKLGQPFPQVGARRKLRRRPQWCTRRASICAIDYGFAPIFVSSCPNFFNLRPNLSPNLRPNLWNGLPEFFFELPEFVPEFFKDLPEFFHRFARFFSSICPNFLIDLPEFVFEIMPQLENYTFMEQK